MPPAWWLWPGTRMRIEGMWYSSLSQQPDSAPSGTIPLPGTALTAAMGSRHWKEVMRVTEVELNTAEDVFKLQHLLDAHLLAHKDDIEELCACAVKEEQV